MSGYIPGIETPIASARRARFTNQLVAIPLSEPERAFLLLRLADISATANAMLHGEQEGEYRPLWGRREVVSRLRDLVSDLRRHEVLKVTNAVQRRALREAIEGNPYFARMGDDDPRLFPAAIARANALRIRLARALEIRIGPVPVPRRDAT